MLRKQFNFPYLIQSRTSRAKPLGLLTAAVNFVNHLKDFVYYCGRTNPSLAGVRV